MQIKVETTGIRDILVVIPEVFEDARGFFTEIYRKDQFETLGLPSCFSQLNHSRSAQGVVRGLHFQWDPPMGKLMRVTQGSAYLVAVDIRKKSPTLGNYFALEATASNRRQLWAPAGFARGFCATSDFAEIEYLCTGIYNGKGESGISWNDPAIGIPWPVRQPVLSPRDEKAPRLSEWLKNPLSDHFQY